MQPSDFERFQAVMTGMAEMHQRELSNFLLDAYWLAMRDWSLQDFEAAASHLMQTLKWMPKPSDFTELRRAGEPTDAEAWTTALATCVHWRNSDALPTGRIARAAAAVGGFQAIAMANTERDLPFVQKRFLEAYKELSDVEPVRSALPHVAAHGARAALSAPANIAALLPMELTQRSLSPPSASVALPVRVVATVPAKVAPAPPKSAQEKILALLPLQMDDDAIAKVSGQPIETVRHVRAEQERAA
jgi:hypothetical protein